MSDELHLFTNGTDTVVARDADDAMTVWCGALCEKREDYQDMTWEREPDGETITITADDAEDDLFPDRSGTMTAAEWAKRNGRGFLCSTEY